MNIIPIKIFITLFSLVLLAINCNACKKEEDIIGAQRDVFDYYPKKDTLNVGDTMFFKITIPMILNGCNIGYADSIPIIYNLMYQRYRENRQPNESLVDIIEYSLAIERVVKINGSLTNNKDLPSIFERVDNNYVLEFGYIFKYSGGGGINFSINNSWKPDGFLIDSNGIPINKEYNDCNKKIILFNNTVHNDANGNAMRLQFFIKEK